VKKKKNKKKKEEDVFKLQAICTFLKTHNFKGKLQFQQTFNYGSKNHFLKSQTLKSLLFKSYVLKPQNQTNPMCISTRKRTK
jgi:hypothetical protein